MVLYEQFIHLVFKACVLGFFLVNEQFFIVCVTV